ncbi:hypothetical protein ACOSQ4_009355 [Xanthoceras sorbifolium]
MHIRPSPWLCGGDFNEITSDSEKQEGLPRPSNLLYNFCEALDDCQLMDVGYNGCQFTWSNGRTGSQFIQERLDWCVSSLAWSTLFPFSKISHLEFWRSDHRPKKKNISKA